MHVNTLGALAGDEDYVWALFHRKYNFLPLPIHTYYVSSVKSTSVILRILNLVCKAASMKQPQLKMYPQQFYMISPSTSMVVEQLIQRHKRCWMYTIPLQTKFAVPAVCFSFSNSSGLLKLTINNRKFWLLLTMGVWRTLPKAQYLLYRGRMSWHTLLTRARLPRPRGRR